MLNKIKQVVKDYFHIEIKGNISNYFGELLPKIIIFFLLEQLIISYFDNISNFITTLTAFVIYIIFIFAVRRYNLAKYPYLKHYIYFSSLTAIIFWWYSSDGLNGSISHYFTFSVFSCIVMFSEKEYRKYLYIPTVAFLLLCIIDLLYPDLSLPYKDANLQRLDIFSAMAFSSFTNVLGFLFIKKLYENQQEKLQNQYEEEKKLNEELDNFVYRTSHDLRSPVSSCLGLTDLALASQDMDTIKYYLGLQKKSLDRMDGFISDILHYSRNQRVEMAYTAIDLATIFDEIVADLSYAKSNHHMHFSFENHLTTPLYSDILRIKMIFSNMISNAIRYHDAKKENPYLQVTAWNENEQYVIQFKDNGQGITAESLPKIFDMFYRANKSSDGSGVGLYIVKQAIQKLGGKVECESKLGEGTIFRVFLPINS